jgi:hypothetical protein
LRRQPFGEFRHGHDGNVELPADGLDVAVTADQRISTARRSQLKKDDVLRIANVGQASRRGVDLYGFDIGQEFGQQGFTLGGRQFELWLALHWLSLRSHRLG